MNDSITKEPKKLLTSEGSIVGINLGVWAFDRFAINGPYAHINLNTISNNLKTGFVWDNDMFETNLFAHPYHGGLYFNAARSNGMSFWQSVPFVAGGSLMWEFFMENEYPAINDFLATSIGGVCLGEMTYRLSDRLIDDRTVGLERVKREVMLTLISPARGLNRIISGKAWEHKKTRGNTIPSTPISFYSAIGHRIIGDNLESKNRQDVSNMVSIDMSLYYGNPYDLDNEKPYDFFVIKVGGNLFSKQPIIGRVNALGMIFSKDIPLKKANRQLAIGIFQHFNYYQSKADVRNVTLNPYKLSEAASFGPGVLTKKVYKKSGLSFFTSTYLSAILLGGSQTDHYQVDDRDYNMGSGFSFKTNFEITFKNRARLSLNTEDYRIYSWIGYDPENPDFIHKSVQGDKGLANLSVASLIFNYVIGKHFILGIESSYYYRNSFYSYYPDIIHHVAENKFTVGYIL